MRLLLKAGASVDRADKNGSTPLHGASWFGHAEIAQLLLQARADKDKSDPTPLHRASSRGHAGIVRVLLEARADIDRTCSSTHLFEIQSTCDGETTVEVRMSISERDRRRRSTPLFEASLHGHVEIVRLLLAANADTDKGDSTPLYAASLMLVPWGRIMNPYN